MKSLSTLHPVPAKHNAMSPFAPELLIPIVVTVAAKSAARAWSLEWSVHKRPLYVAGIQLPAVFMAALFGTPSFEDQEH